MQIYEVTGRNVVLAMGTELQLTDRQAEIRASSIKRKKGDIYEVLEPIQFKQGEFLLIASERLSKAVLANLRAISSKEETSPAQDKSDQNSEAPNPESPQVNTRINRRIKAA